LAAGDGEGVLLEQFVEFGCFSKVALAGAGALLAPARPGSTQRRRVAAQRLHVHFGGLDVASERDPGQGLASLPQDVVGERPVANPRLTRQGLTAAGQIIEVTPLLRFADLLFDSAFPLRQFPGRAASPSRRQIFRAN
jgi:hypothetical protein